MLAFRTLPLEAHTPWYLAYLLCTRQNSGLLAIVQFLGLKHTYLHTYVLHKQISRFSSEAGNFHFHPERQGNQGLNFSVYVTGVQGLARCFVQRCSWRQQTRPARHAVRRPGSGSCIILTAHGLFRQEVSVSLPGNPLNQVCVRERGRDQVAGGVKKENVLHPQPRSKQALSLGASAKK